MGIDITIQLTIVYCDSLLYAGYSKQYPFFSSASNPKRCYISSNKIVGYIMYDVMCNL